MASAAAPEESDHRNCALDLANRLLGDIDLYAYSMHTACMEIEFDPEKAALNLRKHRVSFAHAEQALRDSLGITIEEPDSEAEPRFITLGADSLGRFWS